MKPTALSSLSRRSFLASSAAIPLGLAVPAWMMAAEQATAETKVTQLFKSLNEEQRKTICFPFDHALRSKVDNNWMIVKQSISAVLDKAQQDLVKQIFMDLHSEEYAEKVLGQVVHDSDGEGFEAACAVAIFGEPGTGKFELVLTGRHCTRRCDGDSVAGAAFGGPIFYGHAAKGFNEAPDHKGNAYWYQAQQANAVYQVLDGKQREKALCEKGRAEQGTDTVKLADKPDQIDGILVSDLAKDQQGLVDKVLADLLAPFRKQDAAEAMKLIKHHGLDTLRMAFYKQGDLGNDQVWDVWQLESPNMVWHFRGSPHVHCWVNIREAAKA
jgi:hypothetical protein